MKDFGSYKFPELLSFRGELSSETDGILHLRGEISLTYDSECVRCLRPVHETIVIPVDEEIYPLGYKADLHRLFPVLDPEELADNTADDPEEMVFHDNKYVDLEKLLQDQALLALPIGVYCESDCPGLCPTCGRRKDDPDCHCEETVVINSPFDKLRELM